MPNPTLYISPASSLVTFFSQGADVYKGPIDKDLRGVYPPTNGFGLASACLLSMSLVPGSRGYEQNWEVRSDAKEKG